MAEQQVQGGEPVGGETPGSAATNQVGTGVPAGGVSGGTGTQTPSAGITPPAAGAGTGEGDTVKEAEDKAAAAEVAKAKHLSLTQDQLNDRITQAKRAAAAVERARLREIFGTDDIDQIKKFREEHAAFKTEAEKKAREQMTREQQLESDYKAAQLEIQTLKSQIEQNEADRAYEKQDASVRALAKNHISDDLVDDVLHIFARTVVQGMSEEDAAQLDDTKVEKWFAEFAKKKPAFGRTPAPAGEKAKEKEVQVQKKPITNGAKADAKPSPNQTSEQAEKTPRPGKPNSMSPGEYSAYLRSRGLQY